MEMKEVELVLEKIWDLHDKLSDAIHSISRTHFKSLKNPDFFNVNGNNDNKSNGFVFVKDFDKISSAIVEAKSLNSIRSALENLEQHLDFFHNMQVQQRAERDAAHARLEQSRLILAARLAEHHGNNYKLIDEAINFVGDVRDATCFTGPTELSTQQVSPNIMARVLLSGLETAKKTVSLVDKMGGVLGNAALLALSMLALLHLHQLNLKDSELMGIGLKDSRPGTKSTRLDGSHLDVRLARG